MLERITAWGFTLIVQPRLHESNKTRPSLSTGLWSEGRGQQGGRGGGEGRGREQGRRIYLKDVEQMRYRKEKGREEIHGGHGMDEV